MKKILMFLVLLSYIAQTYSQGIYWYNDATEGSGEECMVPIDTIALSNLRLKGKVKLIKSITFYAKSVDDVVFEGQHINEEFAYIDPEAEETPYEDLDFTFGFDNQGRMAYSLVWKYEETFLYNDSGQLVKKTKQELGDNISTEKQPVETVLFSYSDSDISSASFYVNDNIEHKEQYSYDSRHNLISITSIDNENKVIETSTAKFEYDTNGRLIFKEFCEPGFQPRSIRYTYDSDGNLLTETSITRWGDKSTQDYTKEPHSDSLYVYGIPTFNDAGEIVEWKEKEDSKDIYTYSYSYDNTGNWIRKIEFKNNEPTIIRRRYIDYH